MGCQEPHLMNLNGPLVAFLDMASSVFKRLRGCGHRCSTDINYIVRYLDSYFLCILIRRKLRFTQ